MWLDNVYTDLSVNHWQIVFIFCSAYFLLQWGKDTCFKLSKWNCFELKAAIWKLIFIQKNINQSCKLQCLYFELTWADHHRTRFRDLQPGASDVKVLPTSKLIIRQAVSSQLQRGRFKFGEIDLYIISVWRLPSHSYPDVQPSYVL